MKVARLSALRTGRLYPQEMFLVLIFTRGRVDRRAVLRSEGMLLKDPVTPPGIDPGTVRLAAQRLNHYATPDPTCYSKHVNILTPTLVQSKSFGFWVPTSQSPETDVNLAIRPKKIISNVLVFIPAIHENKWYVNCLCPIFPFAQWT
jgi:hypothetical protein